MPFYPTSSVIGAKLGDSDGATAKFTLGQRLSGSDDSEWVYVRANVALTTGHVLKVNNNYSAALSNGSLLGKELCFSQGVFAASDYGFVAKRGGTVVGTLSITPDSPLGLPMESVYADEVRSLRRQVWHADRVALRNARPHRVTAVGLVRGPVSGGTQAQHHGLARPA